MGYKVEMRGLKCKQVIFFPVIQGDPGAQQILLVFHDWMSIEAEEPRQEPGTRSKKHQMQDQEPHHFEGDFIVTYVSITEEDIPTLEWIFSEGLLMQGQMYELITW